VAGFALTGEKEMPNDFVGFSQRASGYESVLSQCVHEVRKVQGFISHQVAPGNLFKFILIIFLLVLNFPKIIF
jgi:hypothetical protein